MGQPLPTTAEAKFPEVRHFALVAAARLIEVGVRREAGPGGLFRPQDAWRFYKLFHCHAEVRQMGTDILSHLLWTEIHLGSRSYRLNPQAFPAAAAEAPR